MPRRKGKNARVDWKRARLLYEREGKNYTEIARKFGCKAHTVSAHAKREGWVNGRQLLRETAEERREKLYRDFVERDGGAIIRSLTKKHELASRLLVLAEGHIVRLETGILLMLQKEGVGAIVQEDPVQAIRKLGLVLQNIVVVDHSLGDLETNDWRPDAGTGGESAESVEASVLAHLEAGEAD